MSAPKRGSKRSDAARKARAQAAPIAKKKRRLKVPDDMGGRGGEGETQSQPPAVPKRSQRQQKQAPQSKGEHEA